MHCVVGGELLGMIATQPRVKQQVALGVTNEHRELNRTTVGGPAPPATNKPSGAPADCDVSRVEKLRPAGGCAGGKLTCWTGWLAGKGSG